MSAGENNGLPASQSNGPDEAANDRCLVCGGDLQRGIVLDHGHLGQPTALIWLEGAWGKSWWNDFKLPDRGARYVVQASRCERCHRLEFYASTKV